MFGAFRPSLPHFGGLLWKSPYRLSTPRKRRQRKRLRLVDNLVSTLTTSLTKHSMPLTASLRRWHAEMPAEAEMVPRDKYTLYDRKVKGYRKGAHKLPKWTRLSQRVNPPGF